MLLLYENEMKENAIFKSSCAVESVLESTANFACRIHRVVFPIFITLKPLCLAATENFFGKNL